MKKPSGNINIDLMNTATPSAVKLEEAVLGACMLDRALIALVISSLPIQAIYLDRHKFIYQAIIDLFTESRPVDILTVTERCRKNGNLDSVGGPAYIVELSNKVASGANVEYHCHIIKQKWIKRHAMSVGYDLYLRGQDPTVDPFDLLEQAESGLYELSKGLSRKEPQRISAALSKEVKRQEEIASQPDGLLGISTGFKDLDKVLRGLRAPDLVILAARPGMGKTALTLAIAKYAAETGNPTAFFSLEMSAEQLVQRMIAMDSELTSVKVENPHRRSEHDHQLYNQSIQNLDILDFFIDDEPGLNIIQLRSKCRRLKQENDIKLVVVDYLQLMEGTGRRSKGSREQEISEISRGLKVIAKELEVPVIALSQLSRAVEQRGGTKRPQLSDLRESGSIEQDADIVSFIYRPEYYNIFEDSDGTSTKGLAEIIIAKHRRGSLQTVDLNFRGECTKFSDRLGVDSVFETTVAEMNEYEQMSGGQPSKIDDEDLPF